MLYENHKELLFKELLFIVIKCSKRTIKNEIGKWELYGYTQIGK